MAVSEPTNPPSLLGQAILDAIRQAVREEIQAATNNTKGDRLLDPEEAAKLLSVSEDWIYHNAKKLPFTRKLGPRLLRFSYHGMLKWMESKKFGSI
jgi:predicted DNA-binding transcriptional regulator AlpA